MLKGREASGVQALQDKSWLSTCVRSFLLPWEAGAFLNKMSSVVSCFVFLHPQLSRLLQAAHSQKALSHPVVVLVQNPKA